MKILIFGPAVSGKTTLARPLAKILSAIYISADEVEQTYGNKSTYETTARMKFLALGAEIAGKLVVVDWEASKSNSRAFFEADFAVWMDTVGNVNGFTRPKARLGFDYHVSEWFDDTDKQLADVILAWTQSAIDR